MLVFFLPDLKAGGAERVNVNLMNYFHENYDVEVALLLGNKSGPLLSEIAKGIEIYSLNSDSGKSSIIPFIRFCNKVKPEVVIATLGASIATSFAKPFISSRIVIVNRIGSIIGAEKLLYNKGLKRRLYLFATKIVAKKSDRIIFQCNYMKNDFISEVGVQPKDSLVVFNPINVKKILNLSLKNIEEKFDFVAIGRLEEVKGYPILLKACRELKKTVSNFSLAIIGEGTQYDLLSELITEYDLEENVKLMGYIKNPYPYILSSKSLISTSIYEGFSNVIIEALCLGTLVIATDCPGGNKEIIEDGVNGYLIKNGDWIELFQKMVQLKNGSLELNSSFKNKSQKKFGIAQISETYKNFLIG